MPTLKELVNSRLERIDSIPTGFVTAVELTEKQMFKDVLRALDELERDALGNVILNDANIARIQLMPLERAVYSVQYQNALVGFAGEFNQQATLNNEYFTQVFKNFSVKEIYDKILKTSQARAVELLDLGALDTEVTTPLRALINDSVGKDFATMVENVDEFLKGTQEFDGQLTRYSKTVAFDAFATSDRAYMEVIANDLGVNKFRYQGSLVKDSREFCVVRVGKEFKKEEIKKWGDPNFTGAGFNGKGSWQGRNRNTNENTIFTFLGGHNCKHSLVPL